MKLLHEDPQVLAEDGILTAREREVVNDWIEGQTFRETANMLGVSVPKSARIKFQEVVQGIINPLLQESKTPSGENLPSEPTNHPLVVGGFLKL